MKVLFLVLSLLAVQAAFADTADHDCNVILRQATIFKDHQFVQARVDVSRDFLKANPNTMVKLRVSNINGVRGMSDLAAKEVASSPSSKFRNFVVEFKHNPKMGNLSLGVISWLKLEDGSGLFDWNDNSGGSFGMLYFDEHFEKRPEHCYR